VEKFREKIITSFTAEEKPNGFGKYESRASRFDSSHSQGNLKNMKNIDLKSLLIGFLLATTLLLAMGAASGTQNVRIVGIDKNFTDWDAIKVDTGR